MRKNRGVSPSWHMCRGNRERETGHPGSTKDLGGHKKMWLKLTNLLPSLYGHVSRTCVSVGVSPYTYLLHVRVGKLK